MCGYRGKSQFTVINYSNRAKTLVYRGKMRFTAIIYSKKAQNTGSKTIHSNHSFKNGKKRVIGVQSSLGCVQKRVLALFFHPFFAL
jgi:hypothetical protein